MAGAKELRRTGQDRSGYWVGPAHRRGNRLSCLLGPGEWPVPGTNTGGRSDSLLREVREAISCGLDLASWPWQESHHGTVSPPYITRWKELPV